MIKVMETKQEKMTQEKQLVLALEESVRWKNYAEDLKKERDGWLSEYRAARAEVERLKPTWFFIDDKQPDKEGAYIVFIPGKGRFIRWWKLGWFDYPSQFIEPTEAQITHWSELIESPKYPF